jgi:NTP pyrophosphatase (non-canonical NTP hydrolase)
MKEVEELIKLANLKDKIDIKRGEEKYFDTEWLIGELLSEVDEVKEEIKPNNAPFLEDELGDILWGWLIVVQKLKSKGLVTSHKNIIKRALKKYQERIIPLNGDKNDYKIWQSVKDKQKEELKEENINFFQQL